MGYLFITLEINGKKLYLGKDSTGSKATYGITKITGLAASEYEIITAENALLDGSTVTGKRILKRPVSIEATARDVSNCQLLREYLISFFNPKYTGTMTVDRSGEQRNIEFEIEAFTEEEETTVDNEVSFQLDLMCPNPYFKNVDNFGKNMADKTPLFAFPWRITASTYSLDSPYQYFGKGWMGMAYRTLKQDVTLTNDGDVETPIIIQFIATRGGATNPIITDERTGKYMRIVLEMEQGDVLEIDTSDDNQIIELNGENVYQYIDKSSEPFKIQQGENYLSYDADENYTNLDVKLYYTPLYLGV